MNELPYVVTTVSICSGCDFCIWCRCSLSKNNRCILPCVVTGHLISSGWIFICYHCCFNLTVGVVFHMLSLPSLKKEWSSVSVCYDFTLNKQWIVFSVITFVQEAVHVIFHMFPCFVTAYLVSIERFSFITVDVIFCILLLRSFKNQ